MKLFKKTSQKNAKTPRRLGPWVTILLGGLIVSSGFAKPSPKNLPAYFCWKNLAGKIEGCGNQVPKEYQNASIEQRDAAGHIIPKGEVTEKPNQPAADSATKTGEVDKEPLKLWLTFNNETDIDRQRDREIKRIDDEVMISQRWLSQCWSHVVELENIRMVKPSLVNLPKDLAVVISDCKVKEENIQILKKIRIDVLTRYDRYKIRFKQLNGTAERINRAD